MPAIRFLCIAERGSMQDYTLQVNSGHGYIFAHVYAESDKPRFACFGTPYLSQDGEYRSCFTTWSQVTATMREYKPLYDRIETEVRRGSGGVFDNFELSVDPTDKSEFCRELTGEMLMRLFCYWLHFVMFYSDALGHEPHAVAIGDMYVWDSDLRTAWRDALESIHNYSDGHIDWSDRSHSIVSSVRKMAKCAFDSTRELYSMQIPRHCANHYFPIICGQKLIPLTDLEWENKGDINYPAWREIYLANICSNLAVDRVARGFSYMASWFYITDRGETIYMNPAIHERFRNSALAGQMIDDLEDLDRKNYRAESRSAINGRFAKMSRRIMKSLEFAHANIHLSGHSICIVSENVGNTWGTALHAYFDKPAFAMHMRELSLHYDSLFMDILWDLDAMNKQLLVVHGDLHINNCTLSSSGSPRPLWSPGSNARPEDLSEFKIAYRFGANAESRGANADAGTKFAATFTRLTPYIIDFSRALIFDVTRLEQEFSQRYAEIFMKNQRDRIMATVAKYVPEFIQEHKLVIESRILTNLVDVGRAVSAVDAYNFFGGLAISIESYTTERRAKLPERPAYFADLDPSVEAEHLAVFDKIAVLAGKISDAAREVLVANMRGLVDGDFGKVRWANEVVMTKIFAKKAFDVAPEKDGKSLVVDAYSGATRVTHDVRELDLWPNESDPDTAVRYIRSLATSEDEPVPVQKVADDNAEISQWLRKYNVGADTIISRLAESSWKGGFAGPLSNPPHDEADGW